jgi:hypothetical protein
MISGVFIVSHIRMAFSYWTQFPGGYLLPTQWHLYGIFFRSGASHLIWLTKTIQSINLCSHNPSKHISWFLTKIFGVLWTISYIAYCTQYPDFFCILAHHKTDIHYVNCCTFSSSDHTEVLYHHHSDYIDFYNTVCSTDCPFVGSLSYWYNSLSFFVCCLVAQRL